MSQWEGICRTLADERARREEEMSWKVEPGDALPFRFRWEHVQEVARHARHLATRLNADMDIAVASAWLHDIRKVEPDHGRRGAAEAERVLAATDFPAAKIPAVAHAVRHHVGLFRKNPATPLEPLDTAILWDADKLTKLGVPQIAYLLSAPRGQRLTLAERRGNVWEYVYNWVDRTAESMNTEPARTLARVRYREMVAFTRIWQHQATDPFDAGSDDLREARAE